MIWMTVRKSTIQTAALLHQILILACLHSLVSEMKHDSVLPSCMASRLSEGVSLARIKRRGFSNGFSSISSPSCIKIAPCLRDCTQINDIIFNTDKIFVTEKQCYQLFWPNSESTALAKVFSVLRWHDFMFCAWPCFSDVLHLFRAFFFTTAS